ncbi:MAG: molybdopterin-dependent oxidoreductase [Chloroflexi bacterium]|nr:molybdopterin-dependent oxidoreductase [Chloroflexota bacterium]
MAEKVTITIDGQTIQADKGTPVLKAALDAGLYIPHFCYWDGVSVFAGCRLCVVEIEGMRGFPTSCTTQVQEGMVVRTKTADVLNMQRGVMSFMLSDHPDRCLTCHRQEHCGIDGVCLRDAVVTYRCLTCAKNKRCEFQSGSEYLEMHRQPAPYYQEANSWFGPDHDEKPIRRVNPFIELDFNECILCTRCVRTCDEVRGLHVYELSYKGPQAQIDTVMGLPMADVGCDFCGACIDVCPVACIMDRPSKWQALPQAITTTICPHCADGCQIAVETKRNKVLRVTPEKEGPANAGIMCARGRWGLGFSRDPQRLTTPLIKRNGGFVEATWEEALTLVAQKLGQYRGEAVGVLGSAKATNEEHYLLQKLARSVLGSNNVDSYSRLDRPEVVQDLREIFGYPAMTNSLWDISEAKTLFIIGSNTAVTHPVAAWRARNPVRFRGSTLILAHPRATEMNQYADLWLQYRPGTEVALVGGMLRVILDEGLADGEFLAARTEGLEDLRRSLADFPPERVADITGIPAEDIAQAARLFAAAKPTTILYDVGLTEYTANTDGVKALAALALATGNIGLPGGGLNALRGAANDQGAWDMGLRPDLLPGYAPVTATEARTRLQEVWGGALPATPGQDLAGMVAAAQAGTLKAMYLVQADPALDDPAGDALAAALEKLEFLVVQDHVLTQTAELADVVLPAATSVEIEGTFTNTERRVQLLRPALPLMGDSRPGWWILHEVGNLMGGRFVHEDAADVFAEIAQVVPEYAGLSHERLEAGGIQWPCPTPDHEGTPVLYAEGFPSGKARLLPIAYLPLDAAPDEEYPLLLAAGRELVPYHQEVLVKGQQGLRGLLAEALRLSPDDAERLGVGDGDRVRLVARTGQVEWTVKVAEDVPPGVVSLSYPIVEGAAELAAAGGQELARAVAHLGVCGVRLEKVPVTAGRV